MIFALIGRKAAGKDTVAEMLQCHFGEVLQVAFASHMKEVLTLLFGFPNASFFSDHDKKERLHPEYCKTHTPRQLMEWFGTEVVRPTLGDTFWVDRVIDRVKRHRGHVVVTDVRFPNEAVELNKSFQGGVRFIYIDADRRLGPLPLDVSAPEKAVGQTLLALREGNIPYTVIENNGTLEDLKEQIDEYIIRH